MLTYCPRCGTTITLEEYEACEKCRRCGYDFNRSHYIVVVILGILAGVVIPQFTSASNDAYNVVAKSFEQALQSGVAMYLKNQKRFPSSFFTWVAYSDNGPDTYVVRLNAALRDQLVDPNATVVNNGNDTITLHFKNGLTGTYHIAGNGNITGSYSGP